MTMMPIPIIYNKSFKFYIEIIPEIYSKVNMEGMKGMGSMGSMASMGMNMSAVISWNTKCVVFLFDALHARNRLEFFVGCFVVVLVAVASQMLGLSRVRNSWIGTSHKIEQKQVLYLANGIDSDRANQDKIAENPEPKVQNNESRQIWRTLRVLLYYSIMALLNLLLMLVAMTMNGYIIISVAVGTGIGKSIVMLINESTNKTVNKTETDKQMQKIQEYFCEM